MFNFQTAASTLLIFACLQAYAADDAPGMGSLMKLLFGKHSTPATEFDSVSGLVDNTIAKGNVAHTVRIFADQWLFADGRRIALGNDGIFEKRTAQASWRAIYDPQQGGDAVSLQFDGAGKRGVAYFESATVTTIDGGLHWRPINADTVVKNHFGTDDFLTSGKHLDPVSGHGSFTSNCTYFSTADFAKSWQGTTLLFSRDEQRKKACLSRHPFALDTHAGLALVTHAREDYILARPEAETSSLKDWQPLCETGSWVPDVDLAFCGDIKMTAQQQFFYDRISRAWRRPDPYLTVDTINRLIAGEPLPEAVGAALRDNGVHQWLAGEGYLAIADGKGRFEFEYRIPVLKEIYPLNATTALGVAWNRVYATRNGGTIWRLISQPGKRAGVVTQSRKNGSVLLYDGVDYKYWTGRQSIALGNLPEEIEDIDLWIPSQSNRHMWVLPYESHYYWISKDSGQSWHKYLAPFPPARVDDDRERETPWPISFDCRVSDTAFDCTAVYEDGYLITWKADSPEQHELIATPDLVSTEDFFNGERLPYGTIHLLGAAPSLVYFSDIDQLFINIAGEWTARSTKRSYSAQDRRATGDDTLLQLPGEKEVLTIDATGRQGYYRFSDMNSINRQCYNDLGAIVLIDDDKRVVLTLDGGSNWSAALTYQAYRNVACGIYKHWIWMLEDRLTVVSTQTR